MALPRTIIWVVPPHAKDIFYKNQESTLKKIPRKQKTTHQVLRLGHSSSSKISKTVKNFPKTQKAAGCCQATKTNHCHVIPRSTSQRFGEATHLWTRTNARQKQRSVTAAALRHWMVAANATRLSSLWHLAELILLTRFVSDFLLS